LLKHGLASGMPNDISFQSLFELGGKTAPNAEVVEDTMRDIYDAWRVEMRRECAAGGNVLAVQTDHWSDDDRTAVGVVVTIVTKDWRRSTDVVGLISTGDERVTAEMTTLTTKAVLDYMYDNDVVIAFGTTDTAAVALKSMEGLMGGDAGIPCVLHLFDLAACDVTGKKLKHKTSEQRERALARKLLSNCKLNTVGVTKLRHIIVTVANVYTAVYRKMRALQALEDEQIKTGTKRNRLVTPKYEAATRWLSALRMLRSHLALRPHYLKLKQTKTQESDADTLLPADLDVLDDAQTADCIDIVRVFEIFEKAVLLLQSDRGNVAAVTPKTLRTLHSSLSAVGESGRIGNDSVGPTAVDVAAALAEAINVRMSYLWLEPNYLYGTALLDITATNDVSDDLFAGVLDIITVVSFQISEDHYEQSEINVQTPARCADLRALITEMRASRSSFIDTADGAPDIGLAYWREVATDNIKLSTRARTAFAWFQRTVRAFMTITPSEAAVERAFSCAKLVLDGRDSLRDSHLERGVVLRSYLLRRCSNKTEWSNLLRKFAAEVHRRRQARKK
jgi:hypothetical protein